MDAYSNELRHHGVVGMKWGVRKDPQPAVSGVRKPTKAVTDKSSNRSGQMMDKTRLTTGGGGSPEEVSPDFIKYLEDLGYDVSEMSDADLAKLQKTLLSQINKIQSGKTGQWSDVGEDFLAHHGILGMKWGVRRFQKKDGSLTPRGRLRLAKLEKEANKLRGANPKNETDNKPIVGSSGFKKSDVSKLSDDEIRARINRVKLEQDYAKMFPDDRSRGKQFVQDILGPIAKKRATELLDSVSKSATTAVSDLLGKSASDKIKSLLGSKLGVKEESKGASGYKLEDISKLSTEELKARNDRMQAERTYRNNFLNPNGNKNALENAKKMLSGENPDKKKSSDSNDSENKKDSQKKKKSSDSNDSENKKDSQKKDSHKNDSASKPDSSNQTPSSTPKLDRQNPEHWSGVVKVEKPYKVLTEENRHEEGYKMSKEGSGRLLAFRQQQKREAAKQEAERLANERLKESTRQYLLSQQDRIDHAHNFIESRYEEYDLSDLVRVRHSEMESWRKELYSDELFHHGIKGQRWGIRRYQNPDGSMTDAGRKRLTEKGTARSFNNATRVNDVSRGNAMYYKNLSQERFARFSKKYVKTGKDKYLTKAKESMALSKEYDKVIKKGEAMAKKIQADAEKRGMKAKDYIRGVNVSVANGKEFAMYLRDNMGGAVSTTVLIKSKKYKAVKK